MKNAAQTHEKKQLSQKLYFSAINDRVDFGQHTHDYYEIVMVLENHFLHTVNNVTRRPERGEIVILRPGDTHSAVPLGDGAHVIRDIYVHPVLFEDVCAGFGIAAEDVADWENRENCAVFTVERDEVRALNSKLDFPFFIDDVTYWKENAAQTALIKRAIVSQILGLYYHKNLLLQKTMPNCVVKIVAALQDPRFRDLSIAEMAYELGYSHPYLCEQFKTYFGKTIQRFLIDARLEKAAGLLTETNHSVEQISRICGWSKTSSFIRNFSRTYGQTPSQYRKSAQAR